MKSLKICTIALAALILTNSAHAQPRPAGPKGVNVLRDLAYVEHGHERNRLDLYLPEKVPETARAPLPVVVWIHGGAWQAGNKDRCPAVWLVGKGYAVASINYRLSQHAVFPAQIEDCKAAIRWLRANAAKHYLDPDRIGVWGESAGGHLVALLGTTGGVKELEGKGGNAKQSSRVQCVVDWFGPTDMVSIVDRSDNPDGPVEKLIGGPVKENLEKAKKASPLTYVSKDSAPFLIMHGDKDPLVPLKQSEALAEALVKAGVEVKLQVIKDNGHGGPGFGTPESHKLIEEFFDKHLKGTDSGKTGMTPQKPRVLVTISKETTYITGPLRKDGYVDYVAAVNERFKQGVTPENNAAVLLWQAIGPSHISEKKRSYFFKMLGISEPSEQGEYWISQWQYWGKLKDPKNWQYGTLSDEDFTEGNDQLFAARRRPWSEKEFPKLAGWLAANEKPLTLIVEASKRSRFYEPPLAGENDAAAMIAATVPHALAELRDVLEVLAARAMLRLKLGNISEAWEDLLACLRLARLTNQEPGIMNAVTSNALERKACESDQALFQYATFSATHAKKAAEDLARLPQKREIADRIDFEKRFAFLDLASTFARGGIHYMKLIGEGIRWPSLSDSELGEQASASFDWDVILRAGNSTYDRLVIACRKTPPAESQNERLKLIRAIRAKASEAKGSSPLDFTSLLSSPRLAASERLGNILLGIDLPGTVAYVNAENDAEMRFQLTRLGFVLAAYRADHGAYPKKLSELSPNYVAKVPGDVFANDGPLHYKRQGAGYLLYSIGLNGNDDNGRDAYDEKDEDWDDIAIRVP